MNDLKLSETEIRRLRHLAKALRVGKVIFFILCLLLGLPGLGANLYSIWSPAVKDIARILLNLSATSSIICVLLAMPDEGVVQAHAQGVRRDFYQALLQVLSWRGLLLILIIDLIWRDVA